MSDPAECAHHTTTATDPGRFFDDAPCGFLIVGPDWTIRRVNATLGAWMGTAPEVLVGQHLRNLLDVAGRIFFDTHFAPLVRLQGAFHEVALNLKRSDGSRMATLVNAAERTNADGEIEAMLVTVFNATDRRRYEAELLDARNALRDLNETLEERVREAVEARLAAENTLRQAQKMEAIGNLSGGIAHDFNNILQIVSANLGLLSKRLPDEGKSFLVNAQAGVDRGAQLAQQLLAFGRRKPVQARVVDAVAVVVGMRDLLDRTLRSSTRIDFDMPSDVLPVEVDAAQLENAVLNLCVNGRDAMADRSDGALTVAVRSCVADSTKRPGDLSRAHVEIRVTDNGEGMDAATVAKVFEPFFTTKPAGKGTGLGLAMVYGFARQSQGKVTIDSRVGEGTAVSIWLPQSAKHLTRSPAAAKMTVQGGSETVLLVEDNRDVRDTTRTMLADLGYHVLIAANGAEAREHLQGATTIDVTIFDLILRGSQDGMALVREFKAEGYKGSLLLTSGQADEFDDRLDRSIELLRKPYDRTALSAAVRRAIGTEGREEAIGEVPILSSKERSALDEGMRVLLVEDEILIRMTAADQMTELGHTVLEAASAEEAIELLEEEAIDVLMTDLNLPGLDGGTLARIARDKDPFIGIVFATGADELPDVPGNTRVRLNKPYSENELGAALKSAFRRI